MVAQLLAVAVARFEMASTVSCCRYRSSGLAVALCAAPLGVPVSFCSKRRHSLCVAAKKTLRCASVLLSEAL